MVTPARQLDFFPEEVERKKKPQPIAKNNNSIFRRAWNKTLANKKAQQKPEPDDHQVDHQVDQQPEGLAELAGRAAQVMKDFLAHEDEQNRDRYDRMIQELEVASKRRP